MRLARPDTETDADADVVDIDPRLGEVDRLVRHVADRLRRSGVDLPVARLNHLAEELVVDVTRVALAWAEEPLPRA